MNHARDFIPLLLVLLTAAGSVNADVTIVVNFGQHPSAEAAGGAEAEVNWLDDDQSDDTVCTECFAALELRRYLRKMTGRTDDFAIIDDGTTPHGELILVGGAASNAVSRRLASDLGADAEHLATLGRQGYRIKTIMADGHRVTLVAGGGREGTLYGVYDLLHRLGCRWFAPGELHEEVPQAEWEPDFDSGSWNVAEQPSFLGRGFHAWEDRGNPDFLLWMARNRLNEWCVEQSGHPLMRKLGIRMAAGGHDAQARFLNPNSPYPYNHPRFQGDDEKPKDPYAVSDQYRGDADSDGRLSYFEAHPEWFALVDGHRIPGIQGDGGTNFCTSNPEATAEFLGNFVQALVDGDYRDADVVRFWTLDVGRWCQCRSCQALGSPTDRNLLLVHEFDRKIKQARAAGKISRPLTVRFLVYADVLAPPTRPLPADFDYQTCAATFYPIRRCYVHNFNDVQCDCNAQYCRQIRNWASQPDRFYRGQLVIGEYYNVSGYKCLPICFMHTMANDIPYYYQVGARYFDYMHVSTCHWGNKALTNYQMARQLWDVDTDCEALWQDYFSRRYGLAAPTMRRFYESLEKALCNVTELKYGLAPRLDRGAKDLFPTPQLRYRSEPGVQCDGPTLVEIVAHVQTCRRLIDEALAAELPARIKARISEDERMFTYGQRTIEYLDECVQAFQCARSGDSEDARRHFVQAARLADLLRQDVVSTSMAGQYAGAPNALAATYAVGALDRLAKILGPPGKPKN